MTVAAIGHFITFFYDNFLTYALRNKVHQGFFGKTEGLPEVLCHSTLAKDRPDHEEF